MKPLPPVNAVPLFPDERAALLELLRSLTPEQWALPTVCEGWSVKDVASHLIADDVGRLGWQRDGYSATRFEPTGKESFEVDLRAFIDSQNESWVAGTRRLSSRIIIDLLEWGGNETQALFESLDPDAPGLGVSWAGESESPNWFDLAREYTERWHHQSQIRDAVGAPMLYEPRLFGSVIDTMVQAIPHALRETNAADGAMIRLVVTGTVARTFDLARKSNGWTLGTGASGEVSTSVTMDADTAWRMLTRNLAREEIILRSQVIGDSVLADAVFKTFALVT